MKLGRIRPAPRKPAPKKLAPVKPTPVKPTPSPGLPSSPDRGNVERNYRGIPGLVNATAPIPRGLKPAPVNVPEVGFPGGPGGETRYSTRPSSPVNVLPKPPAGGAPATGSTGFKSAFGGIDSNMLAPSGGATGGTFANQLLGKSAPSGGATGNSVNFPGLTGGVGPRPVLQGMKKGGEVKASKAPKASSASKRGDGIATKGKTKGRFV